MSHNRSALFIITGLTMVVVGYFTVWLPGPSAGLRLIGLELGEWIKFLGVGTARDLFYLPPVCAGLVMALLTVGWDNRNWRTWVMRMVAVGVALIALPAVASIMGEPRSEWLLRVLLTGGVGLTAVLAAFPARSDQLPTAVAWMIVVVSLTGLILPFWQYVAIRPVVAEILRDDIGIGLGVWLNSAGFAAILAGIGLTLRRSREYAID